MTGSESEGEGEREREHESEAEAIERYDELEAHLQQFITNHEFLSWLGTTVESVEDGTVTMAIPYDSKLTTTRQGAGDRRPDIHGGVAATLLDTVGAMALRTTFDDHLNGTIATINLSVNYLRPATGDLTATADVIRTGSSIGVSEITVESTAPEGETREVATGQGSYRLFLE